MGLVLVYSRLGNHIQRNRHCLDKMLVETATFVGRNDSIFIRQVADTADRNGWSSTKLGSFYHLDKANVFSEQMKNKTKPPQEIEHQSLKLYLMGASK